MVELLSTNPFYKISDPVRAKAIAIFALERDNHVVLPHGIVVLTCDWYEVTIVAKKAANFLINRFQYEISSPENLT